MNGVVWSVAIITLNERAVLESSTVRQVKTKVEPSRVEVSLLLVAQTTRADALAFGVVVDHHVLLCAERVVPTEASS